MAASSSKDSFPKHFLCPITNEVMMDPVRDPEGNYFERSAIEDWLDKNDSSPVTRTLMRKSDLQDADDLRADIRVFLQASNPSLLAGKGRPEDSKIDLSVSFLSHSHATSFPLSFNDSTHQGVFLNVTVTPPDSLTRTPLDICCVVDVSGSMQMSATVQNAQGQVEDNGLSILDIVKHSVKTIIKAMSDGDRLALVSFSSTANEVLPLTQMDANGQNRAIAALETMEPDGSTNLWDGLRRGMDILLNREKGDVTRYASCLILTDGQPNVEPPRGHIPTLRKYRDQHVTLPCSIHTFGFGYGIESVLLTDIAKEGGGEYIFIPDGGFVGTAFVNAASNLLTSLADHVEVLVETADGVKIAGNDKSKGKEGDVTLGHYPIQRSSWGVTAQLGTLHYGQSRSIIIPLIAPKGLDPRSLASVTVRYQFFNKAKGSIVWDGEKGEAEADVSLSRVHRELCRVHAIEGLLTALKTAESAFAQSSVTLRKTIEMIEKSEVANDPLVSDLLKDLTGQATEAFSKNEWYTRWGRHYVPSLSLSHSAQVCSNFKDPGLQHYGGALFRKIQDELDTIFLSLPPPKPSNVPQEDGYGYGHGGLSHSYSAASVSMAAYYNSGNPCFAGRCLVRMADGSHKRVDEIRKGDLVHAGREGNETEILCVVKTKIGNSAPRMVHLPCGLIVTEYHPIRPDGRNWIFPIDFEGGVRRVTPGIPHIYSFVMKSCHVMVIEGMECVGLGHSFTDNDVIRHPYFGSERIIRDLEKIEGYEAGEVVFDEEPLIKSEETSLVDGIRSEYFCASEERKGVVKEPIRPLVWAQ